ncbi:MAG TPA: tryptophan 2,3-dioxygenase [Paracoccaceae bacterium]|nr:tryptophan 2,3-dioxygenase [Paracoccaceae bacterium]
MDKPEGGGGHFSPRPMTYADYLKLDRILGAQQPLSEAPDEMLFIIQHQTTELWMKLAIHEIGAARRAIRMDQLEPAFKTLARVSRIFEQLNSAWDVLRTMTPSDYTHFRDRLGHSSGLQSFQYRMIEFMLGNRNPALLKPHEHWPEAHGVLSRELREPTLYDVALAFLARQGFSIPDAVIDRDRSHPHAPDAEVIGCWRMVYADPEENWAEYQLAEKLVDLEDYFRRWRFNHVTTVERIIGLKRGTGGSAGVPYLRKMLEVELFPDLWRLRTEL